MSRIEKKINNWVNQHLITNEQAEKIKAYEMQHSSRSWILYGFLILGAVTFGIGLIALIAANWDFIPDFIKLSMDFLCLMILSRGTYLAWEKEKPILFEVLLVSFMILCLASIGLISQIYHTGGRLYEALLLWSVITFGLAMISKRSFAAFLWTFGFFSGLISAVMDSFAFDLIFKEHSAPLLMAIPLLSALFIIIFKNIGLGRGQIKALKVWTIMTGLIALIISEFQSGLSLWRNSPDLVISAFFMGYALTLFSAFGVWFNHQYKQIQKLLLLFILIFYLIPFHFPLFEFESDIASASCSIAILTVLAMFFASLKQRGLFQFFLVALGIRFLILYFQALEGLATTGMGLIVCGVIIISMVSIWNKYYHQITLWAERLAE